jgi:hypothetical protein
LIYCVLPRSSCTDDLPTRPPSFLLLASFFLLAAFLLILVMLLLLAGLWNIIQYFLDPVTKEKVKPCYSASEVASYIDPKYLPASMSGTSTFALPELEDIPESPHCSLKM